MKRSLSLTMMILMLTLLLVPAQAQAAAPGEVTGSLTTPGRSVYQVQCPGSPVSRLTIGQLGRVTPGLPNTLRSLPSTNPSVSQRLGSVPGGGVFTVIDGPRCAEGYAWWLVSYNNVYGWTAEGRWNTYWLEPYTQPVPNCLGAPTPRLVLGRQAQVTPGEANVLRDRPGKNVSGSIVIGRVPGGSVISVLDGPRCADGYYWWLVSYNGLVGWTAEGEAGVYWILPLSPDVPACSNLPPRLVKNSRARVTPGPANALRSYPSRNAAISIVIGRIPGGGVFTVVDGPVCGDGYYWWLVNYDGVLGWTPEGEGNTYWLEPWF